MRKLTKQGNSPADYSLDNFPDERQSVGQTFTRAVATSLVLIVLMTDVKYESDRFSFEKKAISTDQIKALGDLKPLLELLVPGQSEKASD